MKVLLLLIGGGGGSAAGAGAVAKEDVSAQCTYQAPCVT